MKTFELRETKHPDLLRVVDWNENWEFYKHAPSGKYLNSVTSILDKGYARPELEEWLSDHTVGERDDILNRAKDKGTKIHNAIDLLLTMGGQRNVLLRDTHIFSKQTKKEEPITNEEWNALLSFQSFWDAHAPVLYISEAAVFNLSLNYAGTIDALLSITKSCNVKSCNCKDLVGKIGLWDWKTSSGIRASYSAQCGAYVNSDNILEYLPKKKKIDYIGILRVGTKHKTTGGYELQTFDPKESFERFKAAKQIADFTLEPFNEGRIVDVPEEITLSVDVYTPKKKKLKTKK